MIRSIKLSNNFYEIVINDLSIFFSYETPVAYGIYENVGDWDCPKWVKIPIVAKNIWTQTTGRHLDILDGGKKENRIEYNKLINELELILQGTQELRR